MLSLLGLLIAGVSVPEGKTPVLINELRAEGIEGRVAIQIQAKIAEEVAKRSEYAVLTAADVKDLLTLEQAQKLVGCTSEAACTARMGELEKIAWVVAGSVGRIGRSLTVTLTLIDTKSATDRNRVSLVADDEAKLDESIAALTRELFAWDGGQAKPRFSLPGGQKSFAVFDLIASGVDDHVAQNLTQILSTELKQIKESRVVSRDDLKAMLTLEASKQLVGCSDDSSCLAEIGAALGVDYIIAGHAGRIGDTWIVSLRLIAPESLSVENRVTETFSGVEEQIVGAVRHAARRLVGLEGDGTGTIRLTTNEAADTVTLDGQPIAESAMDDRNVSLSELRPGRHSLHVIKDDYFTWRSDIYVSPGAETPLAVELERIPREWYESGWFWGTVGGVVAVAAGTTVAVFLINRKDQNDTGPGVERYPFTFEIGLPER